MTGSYVIYDMKTGRITKSLQCPSYMLPLHIEDTETYLEGSVDSDTVYVDLNQLKVVPRPVLNAAMHGKFLQRVPAGATVIIEGERYTADGNPIELEFAYPGTYLVEVHCWPYLNWSTTVENKP